MSHGKFDIGLVCRVMLLALFLVSLGTTTVQGAECEIALPLIFKVLPPTPTATPTAMPTATPTITPTATPIPTPTVVPTPWNIPEIDLLKPGDSFLPGPRYITGAGFPRNEDAFYWRYVYAPTVLLCPDVDPTVGLWGNRHVYIYPEGRQQEDAAILYSMFGGYGDNDLSGSATKLLLAGPYWIKICVGNSSLLAVEPSVTTVHIGDRIHRSDHALFWSNQAIRLDYPGTWQVKVYSYRDPTPLTFVPPLTGQLSEGELFSMAAGMCSGVSTCIVPAGTVFGITDWYADPLAPDQWIEIVPPYND